MAKRLNMRWWLIHVPEPLTAAITNSCPKNTTKICHNNISKSVSLVSSHADIICHNFGIYLDILPHQYTIFFNPLGPSTWHTYVSMNWIVNRGIYWRPFPWWCHDMQMLSALLAFCEGNHESPVDSPHKGPVIMVFDICFSVSQSKLL